MTSTTSGTRTELDVVEEFLAALERLDIDAAIELLDPAIEYQNVPFPPARGIRQVSAQLRGLGRWFSGFEAHTHHIASNGPVVLTERTDVLVAGRVRAEFWVCGTFEVHDGRITLWRDRFDMVDTTWALLRGVVRAPFSRRG
jgi:limonene-1,2-epoxide hydrolase